MIEKSCAEDYRFAFNGQEKSPEISDGHQTALFWEYDARSVHRWNVDPKPNVSISSYAVFGGNPIANKDVKGDTLRIGISSNPSGITQIRLIGSELTRGIAPSTIGVPTYDMTVTDDVSKEVSVYQVTRDAPVLAGVDIENKNFKVANTTFEPQKSSDSQKPFVGIVSNDYAAKGDIAITLSVDGKNRFLPAERNPHASRKNESIAKGNAIHIGGVFINKEGKERVAGSKGCFTICGGNSSIERFQKDITKRAAINRKKGKGGQILISIEKRPTYSVPLEGRVNKEGNVIEINKTQYGYNKE